MKRLLLLLTIIATSLGAAEPPVNDDPRASRAGDAGSRDSAAAVLRLAQEEGKGEPAEEDTEEAAAEEPDAESRSKSPLERFIPSEKISADSVVSFPVDI